MSDLWRLPDEETKPGVIGNGMAGARTVEEILARGGGAPVRYHHVRRRADRKLQSHSAFQRAERVVPGRRNLSESALLGTWRTIFASARGKRAVGPAAASQSWSIGEDGTAGAVRQADHRHRQPAFIPPMEGTTMPDGSFKPGVFVFRTLDDCREIAEYAQGKDSAAVIGGGLLGLEAARGLQNFGLRGERGPSGRSPDAAAAGPRGAGGFSRPASRSWASRSF